MSLRALSVCSGIGAAELAFERVGMTLVASADIEPFPNAVRAHHWPGLANWGDITKYREWLNADVDVLVGGTPCQSFSVAGLRGGLADPRGNLALTFLGIADRYRPRWICWENVPGVLSSSGGRDFGAFLGGLGQLGYGWAYRVLDAQYFGVAQRRRRVFVVGCLGDWRGAAAVLFERESLSGHPAPRREAGQSVARPVAAGSARGSGYRNDADTADNLISEVAHCLNAKGGGGSIDGESETFIAHTLRAEGFDASEDGGGKGTPLVPVAYRTSGNCGAWETGAATDALTTATDPNHHVIAFQTRESNLDVGDIAGTMGSNADRASGSAPMIAFSCKDSGADAGSISPTLRSMGHDGSHANAGGQVAAVTLTGVRRIMPSEAEKLQGFPVGWTDIPYRGKRASDGPRYRALGNSMAVPVMRWIGDRIALVDGAMETTP